jgi:hypothetical protein
MASLDRTPRRVAFAILTATALVAGGVSAAIAQKSPLGASGGGDANVSAFTANPRQLLQQYPDGGLRLSAAVQQIALSDPTTFKTLMGLLPQANDQQKGALGEGLAQAAKILVLTDQPRATEWQQQIGGITDPAFQTAATNAFGDVQLGAIGGGPLGAAGGGGGGTNSGSSNNGTPPTNPVPVHTQFFTFSGSTVGAGAAPNTPNNPVSQ